MTRAHSNDLRERVVAAGLGGSSSREASARFDVAVSSVVKLMQRYRLGDAGQDGRASQAYSPAAPRFHSGTAQTDAAVTAVFGGGRDFCACATFRGGAGLAA